MTAPYDFAAACAEFERTLLVPLELQAQEQPYLSLYPLASIIDTLSASYLPVTMQAGRKLYIAFVEALPSYSKTSCTGTRLSDAMYYAYRCGLLHANVLHATPQSPNTREKRPSTIPVSFSGSDRAPREENGHWVVGTVHLFKTIKTYFDKFRSLTDYDAVDHGKDRKVNFPLRFGPMTVSNTSIVAVDRSGNASTFTESVSARP
jgi:hypothetical protein